MREFFFLFLAWSIFSCNSKTKKEVVQGKLEDFVVGEMSFERDLETGYMAFRSTISCQGKEVGYTERFGTFQFFDLETGKKVKLFQIPKEGPMSLKGGYHVGKAFDESQIIAINSTGNTNFYRNDSLSNSFQLDMTAYEPKGYLNFPEQENALHIITENEFEVTFDPFNFMSFQTKEDGLDLDFGSWIGKFDSLGNWLCKSDFKAPYDQSYANSISAGDLIRLVENGNSWAMFPFSDSLYQIKDCQVINRLKLQTLTPIKYFPELLIRNGNSGSWERPGDGAMNTNLAIDPKNDFRVRLTISNIVKSQPEIKDPRQRMFLDETTYLVLIYDNAWDLIAELEITYALGTRFENLFVSNGHLLINKPEQKSEDEYEFLKIDLSRFSD